MIVSRETWLSLQYFWDTIQYVSVGGGVHMPLWTQAQQQAIDARNDMLLVSAAAGSGKTAVLVERILSLIKNDGVHVDRMLVVTFTRAAAAEMRERIQKALNEAVDIDTALREQALKVDRASISTLHVFCGQVIREHFQAAGLDPMARLVEGGEKEAIYNQALQDVLLSMHEEGKDGFLALSDQFSDEAICEMVNALYQFLMSLPDPWRWMHKQMANFPDENDLINHPWTKQIARSLKIQLEGSLNAAQALLNDLSDPWADLDCEELLKEDIRQIELLVTAAAESLEALKEAWKIRKFPRFPGMKKKEMLTAAWGESLKNKRSKIRDSISKIIEGAPKSLSLCAADLFHTKTAVRSLMRIVRKLHKTYESYKREKNVYDFTDLEHKTLTVLKVPELRKAVQSRFEAVFIDEYQDISGIQEAILQYVHGGKNAFLVGDVKQSIYRFRLADPTLFLQKAKVSSLSEEASFRRIALQENFRSSRSVIQAVNTVFASVMREDATEIEYDQEAMLIAGREPGQEVPVEMHVLVASQEEADKDTEDEAPSKIHREAELAAECILKLRNHPLMDKDTKQQRPYRWRDIAVLLPKAKNTSRIVAETFQKKGIPVYSDADEEYFGLPEIATMMSLLQVLDNPMQDIPLLSVLRSPAFAADEKMLSSIRLAYPGKNVPFFESFMLCTEREDSLGTWCQGVMTKLERWRFLSRCLPLDQLVWQLLLDTGIYARSGALPAGEARQANLRLLCERAAAYDRTEGEGIHGFIDHGESLRKSGDSITAKILGESEDVVRIMTIHKSKGLEFPAAIVMDLGGKIHSTGHGSPIKVHRELGLSIPCIYPEDRTKTKTIAEKAIALKGMEEEKAERARLLYVAMTRARERLILIGTAGAKDPAAKWDLPIGAYRIWQAGSMLDWIIQSVYNRPESAPLRALGAEFSTGHLDSDVETGEKYTTSTGYPQDNIPWNIYVSSETIKADVEKKENIHTQIHQLLQQEKRKIPAETAKRFTSSLRDIGFTLPLKTSVTSLSKKQLMKGFIPSDQEETPEDKGRPEELVLPIRLSSLPERPLFLEKKGTTAADLGTVTHKVLSRLTLSALKNKSSEEIRSCLQDDLHAFVLSGMITKEQYQGLYFNWIMNFLCSDWGKRMLQASVVHREWAFNLRLEKSMTALVQGVIDCCFLEDGAWVLVDYKTDNVIDENAVLTRYSSQLHMYRRALEEITGIPVRETVLFLLRSGKGILIPDGS